MPPPYSIEDICDGCKPVLFQGGRAGESTGAEPEGKFKASFTGAFPFGLSPNKD
jgi:hypothetical protein